MVKASKGLKRGTRRKFKRGLRKKFTVESKIKEFKESDKVIISIDSSSKNFPHPRYLGLIGTVESKRGESYIVSVKLGKRDKTLILRPEHMEKL